MRSLAIARLCAVALVAARLGSPAGSVRAQESVGPGVLPPPSSGDFALPAADPAPPPPPTSSIISPYENLPLGLLPDGSAPTAGDGALDAALIDETITPVYSWHDVAYWFGPDPWSAGIEIGVNGSQGINEAFSLRSGGHLKRETKRYKLDSSLVYNKNVGNGVETQHNAKLDARLDRIIADSPWSVFTLDNLIYDEFQAYNLQLSVNGGLGYQVWKDPFMDLMARFGAGATREFGGPDDEWKPTALLGADYTHKVTATQRLSAKVDYYPEWEDYRNYRVVTDLGWVIDLDQPKNVSLKLSLIDRYDSTPNGVAPNSFDYAVLLIWGL